MLFNPVQRNGLKRAKNLLGLVLMPSVDEKLTNLVA
jgi:hypothetical protein